MDQMKRDLKTKVGPGIDPAYGALAMRCGASSLPGGGDITKMWGRRIAALASVLLLHMSALILLVTTERSVVGSLVFLLAWVFLNCLFLAFARRPIVAALISLEILLTLTLLSRFKFDKLWMTVDFIDLMIVDRDTTAFLLALFPPLRWWVAGATAATIVAIAVAWRFDRYRIRLRVSLAVLAASAAALIAVSLLWPTGLNEDFEDRNYVSKFARTGVEAIHDGSAATLPEAVRMMGLAQLDRVLTESQITAIVAFLNTLTGTYRGHLVRSGVATPQTSPASR